MSTIIVSLFGLFEFRILAYEPGSFSLRAYLGWSHVGS